MFIFWKWNGLVCLKKYVEKVELIICYYIYVWLKIFMFNISFCLKIKVYNYYIFFNKI